MRETFTTLQTQAHNYTQTSSSDTAVNTFLKLELNRAARLVYDELEEYISEKSASTTTTADQQFYQNPRDLVRLTAVKVTINSVDYDLEPIQSTSYWNEINAITFSGTAIPKFFYPRKTDFGIWPTPQDAYTLTASYTYQLKDMTAEDYTTGTISATGGDATITGSGTTFTSAMAGRWFNATADGYWYKVDSFTSSTSIELDALWDGDDGSGLAYTIGESPDIPPAAHELLPFRAASRFFMGLKKNAELGVFWENMFFTGDATNSSREETEARGGLLGLKRRYSNRANSSIVRTRKKKERDIFVDRLWGTTVS